MNGCSAPKAIPRFSPWLAAALLGLLCTGSPDHFRANDSDMPSFEDIALGSGLNMVVRSGSLAKSRITEMFTGGVCVLDYDGDGNMDIYIVNGAEFENRLYRNLGNETFEDVTERAGVGSQKNWGMGCAAADFNNDGAVDLFVTNLGRNQLYRNNGDGTFKDISRSSGVDSLAWSTGAAWGDFDGDGWLDLYVANYVEFDFSAGRVIPDISRSSAVETCKYFDLDIPCGPRGLEPAADLFFRNDGNETFSEVSGRRGLRAASSFGLGVCPSDYDNDGDLDIFVANDSAPNFLFQNNGRGDFQEVALLSGVAYNEDAHPQACMGADLADFDNDGWLDLIVTNFSEDTNTLYRNEGDGFFVDVSTQAGMKDSLPYMGWGVGLVDLDNDGAKDLYVVNGHTYPTVDKLKNRLGYRQPDLLYRNLGNGRFANVSRSLSHKKHVGRGLAFGDFNNDGWLDLVITSIDDRPKLLLSRPRTAHHWIRIRLVGSESNRDGIGARVTVMTELGRQIAEVKAGCSYLSSSDPRVHFGLGAADRIERLVVRWPSGKLSEALDVAVDQEITFRE